MAEQNSPFPPLLIRACAGSGKTFSLSNRFISLLAAGEMPNRILATTFTRKAAGEILDRVFARLAKAALNEKDAMELAVHIAPGNLNAKKAQSLVRELAHNQHRLSICTLDSFFFRVAAIFALEMGLSHGWRIASDTANRIIKEDSIREILLDDDRTNLTSLIRLMGHADQARSVHRKLLDEIPELFELYRISDERAWRGMSLPTPPTDDAVSLAIERFSKLNAPLNKGNGKENSTFRNSMQDALSAAQDSNWSVFIDAGLIKNILADNPSFAKAQIPAEMTEVLTPLIEKAKSVILGRLNDRTQAMRELVVRYAQIYDQHRISSHVLSFNDVKERIVGGAIMSHIDNLYFRLDQSIHHVLLDEFQDTSGAEWKLIEPMIGEILSKSGLDYSFFCVGDVKQAIYGFRGGVAEIFDTLKNRWPNIVQPDPETLTRRCSKPVVACLNTVFGSISTNSALEKCREAALAWAARYEPHQAKDDADNGYVQLRLIDTLAAQSGGSDEVESDTPEISSELDTHVAKLVKELVEKAPGISVGILVRRRQRIKPIVRILNSAAYGIRASEEGGNPVTDSTVVTTILSLLKMVDHPQNRAARFHVANSALGKAIGYVDHNSDIRAIEVSNQILGDIYSNGYGPTLDGWYRLLSAQLSDHDRRRFLQLIELGYASSLIQFSRLSSFIEMVENEHKEDPSSADVRVMTIHKSKGLEFDAVILADLDNTVFGGSVGRKPYLAYYDNRVEGPSRVCRFANERIRSLDPRLKEMSDQMINEQVKDALSVLYVAMTRARTALYMFGKKPKKAGASYTQILADALFAPESHTLEEGLFELGDAKWYSKVANEEIASVGQPKPKPLKIQLTTDEKHRMRGLLREVPSLLPLKDSILLSNVLRVTSAAATRGTLMHRWFQKVQWFEEGLPKLEQALEQGHSLGIPVHQERETFELWRTACEKGKVRDILSKATYEAAAKYEDLRVFTEFKFAQRDENAILSGSIDRLVLGWNKGEVTLCEIIDFKTDQVELGGINSKVEFYRPQIDAYTRAVAKRFGVKAEKITRKLVFPACDSVVAL